MSFSEYVNESSKKIKGFDFAVMHDSTAYDSCITPLKKSDVSEYFSEDNGFDDDIVGIILKLKVSAEYSDGAGLTVFRLK